MGPYICKDLRDTAVSKESSPEKLSQEPRVGRGAHLASSSNPFRCPPPTNKPQENPGITSPFSAYVKLTNTQTCLG